MELLQSFASPLYAASEDAPWDEKDKAMYRGLMAEIET